MKITKSTLRKLIKEELGTLQEEDLKEAPIGPTGYEQSTQTESLDSTVVFQGYEKLIHHMYGDLKNYYEKIADEEERSGKDTAAMRGHVRTARSALAEMIKLLREYEGAE